MNTILQNGGHISAKNVAKLDPIDALYQANILGANLVPSFPSSLGSSASKNLKTQKEITGDYKNRLYNKTTSV